MRTVVSTLIVLCFVGFVTLIVHTWFRLNYVPAHWASGLGWPVFFGGLVPGVFVTYVPCTDGPRPRRAIRWKHGDTFFYAIGLPIFMSAGFAFVVFQTVPMLHALLVRETVTHVFVVADDRPSGSRRSCPGRNGLELARIPMMQETICGVPREIFVQVDRGDRVAVTGLGSGLGVFAANLRVLGP